MTNAILFAALISLALPQGATGNLIVNGSATEGMRGWRPYDLAAVEQFAGVPCFTVRHKGSFSQDVPLPAGAVGMFAVLTGRGQSERINPDGAISGLPYLYALVATADRHRFIAYWQGQSMRGQPEQPTDWVEMGGVFKVPERAAFIIVQLNQAERKDLPQDGSAARFTDVALRLFSSESAARKFLDEYLGR